jgi:predicted alpha-1,2-mannosidase
MKRMALSAWTLFFSAMVAFAVTEGEPDPARYVDPFIGTGGHGHTFPGPCVPFGMVQLSPDTGTEGWDWCSGYHASDSSIMGFSHTHLSGTGAADLGDIMVMAYTGDYRTVPGTKERPDSGYRSAFSHADETASVGYYSVLLKSWDVKAELTATTRCGFQQYTFPASAKSNVIFDLEHGISDRPVETWVEVVGMDSIRGLRRSKGWAPDHSVYFYAQFSKPFDELATVVNNRIVVGRTIAKGANVKAIVRFRTNSGEVVSVKVGLSAVSAENAFENLKAEIGDLSFDGVKARAMAAWNDELRKVSVEGGIEAKKRTFYTALYHSLLVPYVFTDVNGEYRGMDQKIHRAAGFTYYTLFSLWDTFRAAHPLYSIIEPDRNNDFIQSLLAKYDEVGRLPIWELHSNETWCMIGYHSIPVIADAILKGYGSFDIRKAYKAMKESAEEGIRGLRPYRLYGYIPYDKENNSVSITLEYAYDDWCIAQVAQKLGYMSDKEAYTKRALSYRNLFDTQTGFMRGKRSSGTWRPDFNPMSVSILGKGDFTEGNAWQYSFFVPQDVNGLIALYGGDEKFANKLDDLFSQPSVNDNSQSLDVTGLIGQYAHGNEPSHQVAYLYAYAGRAYKTQERVRDIMSTLYSDTRDGLCGNEDCGQMSAWYVLSALGFYPVNPADGTYVVGSPLFDRAAITLPNGKVFIIKANGVSDARRYIQSATLNGKPYDFSFIAHRDVMNGGELVFVMGEKPFSWGCAADARPVSAIR